MASIVVGFMDQCGAALFSPSTALVPRERFCPSCYAALAASVHFGRARVHMPRGELRHRTLSKATHPYLPTAFGEVDLYSSNILMPGLRSRCSNSLPPASWCASSFHCPSLPLSKCPRAYLTWQIPHTHRSGHQKDGKGQAAEFQRAGGFVLRAAEQHVDVDETTSPAARRTASMPGSPTAVRLSIDLLSIIV